MDFPERMWWGGAIDFPYTHNNACKTVEALVQDK